MLVPVSWLKDFVDIDIPIERLAERLTLAGLEVGHITYIGVPQIEIEGVRWPKSEHLVWDREKLTLGKIVEVKPHPDAHSLVLAMVDYGGDELEQCVTGAPNLFDYQGKGPLNPPLWSPFAHEGAEVWDGHSDKPKRMILKGKNLRGIHNKSMVCSEKELGIADSHEGIMLLDNREGHAPGTPLQDVLGDVILDIELTPNLARSFSILGVAREVAALLGKEVKPPTFDYVAKGAPIKGQVAIDIQEPELNPRFTLALLRDTTIKPSPQWIQHRLRLVGQRPINNIVDVTNYITFEIGQPLHAFDYDKLADRAGDKAPTIITRLPKPGETLDTLDEEHRKLDTYNILVCDTAGVLSLGGIIGGAETEISDETTNVLLEAANWNFINIRQTMKSQKVQTDASTRFSRGVHPSQAILGVQRGIELMRQFGGGQVAQGVIDEYPQPPETIKIDLPVSEIARLLGMPIPIETAADILSRLQFDVTIDGDTLHVIAPDHRMDIGTDVVGRSDLVEEIIRIYGYDKIPNTIMADEMPPQRTNIALANEEYVRDLLVNLSLYENINYRFTTPEDEAKLVPPNVISSFPDADYVQLENPISEEKTVLRHTLLISLLESATANRRFHDRLQIFEIGNVYLQYTDDLPQEPRHLGILMTGKRQPQDWLGSTEDVVDFFDLKGVVEGLIDGLHLDDAQFKRNNHTSFHPGRSANLVIGKHDIGTFGELHPLVAARFKLEGAPVLVAEFDLDVLLALVHDRHIVEALPETPPILQDIALIVPEATPAAEVETIIRQSGGSLLADVRLFDVYRGENIPDGHKSLAYNLVYRDPEKTLTDKQVAKVHRKIVASVENRLGAIVRR